MFYVVAAILLAVIFGVLVYQFYAQQRVTVGEPVSAVFAAGAIEQGTVLTEDLLEVRDVPASAIPASYFAAKEHLVGQVTLYPLVQGEVVLVEKLAGGEGGIIAQRCPPAKWCVSVPLSWFIAAPPDMAEGDRLEIASALPGEELGKAGFIATEVEVVAMPGVEDGDPAFVFAINDQEALSLLYAYVNHYQMLVLLRPAGGQ